MIFPWGIVHPCDRIAKAPLHTYRNLSWFFRSFRPKYVQPDQKRRHPERLKKLAGVEPVEPLTDPKVPTSLRKAGRETTINPSEPYGDWKQQYKGRVALRLRPAGAHVLATDAEGGPAVVSHKLGKGRVVFNADLSTNAPAALIEAFLREAGIERVHTEPDDPARIRVFRLPTQDGEVYGITASAAQKAVTIKTATTPVTLSISRSPMVMAGLDKQGRLTACESDGLVKVSGRTIVDATASVMIFALDRKPIEQSEAIVLLPQPYVPADVTLRASPTLDLLEIGDVIDGVWRMRHQVPVQAGPDGVK